MGNREYEPPLDPGIASIVELLQDHGVSTYSSCQGGTGHSREPSVRFFGNDEEGFRALVVALDYGLLVSELRRVWSVEEGDTLEDMYGPYWELIFLTSNSE